MSVNAPNLFVSQFSSNIQLLLQQKGSRLANKVTMGSHTGSKQASPVDQVGAIVAATPAGRFAPKNRTDASLTRRWVFPIDKEIDQLFDKFDQLKMISDPKSKYGENAANAILRAYDDEIIRAATATAYTGETGTGTEAWDTAYDVADDFGSAGTETGLVVPKLIEAIRLFEANEVNLDEDPATLVIGPKQHADLLNQVQVVSTDFNDRPVLVDGRVKRFLGFDIVVSNRLAVIDTDNRACLAFVKSGLYLGTWQDLQNNVSQRNDLSGEPWDLYTSASYGATRIEQGKVLRVVCDE
tara:strand:+ start:90 stop:980 length:891 start_codon:yes stop_codon:yes gene_type:complete